MHVVYDQTFSKMNNHEWISSVPVKVYHTEKISNVYNRLKHMAFEKQIELYEYPKLPPHIADREAYLAEKRRQFGISDGT